MDFVIGVTVRYQLVFLDEGFRQGFGDVFVDLLQDEFLQLGDGARAQAVVFQAFRGVVNALQALADERVLGVVLLDFGVDEIVVVVELTGLAEKHILHARLETVFEPFQPSEPHHFDAAAVIGENACGACGPRCANHLDVGNRSNQLIINAFVVDISRLLDLASVDVAERKLVEHILIGGHAQFLLQDFGLLRPNALQIGDFRLQEVLFHTTPTCLYTY